MRVELDDRCRVLGRVVRGDRFGVLRLERVKCASKLADCGLGIAYLQVTRLLERGERVVDASDRLLVRGNVEVADRVVD